jgi:hypothetical protein
VLLPILAIEDLPVLMCRIGRNCLSENIRIELKQIDQEGLKSVSYYFPSQYWRNKKSLGRYQFNNASKTRILNQVGLG